MILTESSIIITDHAYDRAKERFSLSRKALLRISVRAFNEGVKHSDTTGRLNKYISGVWNEYKTADNIRIYGEILFLFVSNRLITVYQIPNNLKGLIKKFKKK
jgi:hypothetical protein